MNLLNKRNKNYAQVFELFTEESWTENSKNYNAGITTIPNTKIIFGIVAAN